MSQTDTMTAREEEVLRLAQKWQRSVARLMRLNREAFTRRLLEVRALSLKETAP